MHHKQSEKCYDALSVIVLLLFECKCTTYIEVRVVQDVKMHMTYQKYY